MTEHISSSDNRVIPASHRIHSVCISGYTLIEMMMVIAMIAVIASLAILTYRKQAETARVNKVSLEMQDVMQAALTFNQDQGEWPAANNALPNCMPQNTTGTFITAYLPNHNYTSSFGNHYCWSAAGNARERLFWVALAVPGHNDHLARRIAARLPNAIVTADPTSNSTTPPPCDDEACYVRAEVVYPSSGNAGNGTIVGLGYCKPNGASNTGLGSCVKIGNPSTYEITFRACPSGSHPVAMASPNLTRFDVNNKDAYMVPVTDFSAEHRNCTATQDAQGTEHCIINVVLRGCRGAPCYSHEYSETNVGASYIVACVENRQ